jgi:hypothetical protein
VLYERMAMRPPHHLVRRVSVLGGFFFFSFYHDSVVVVVEVVGSLLLGKGKRGSILAASTSDCVPAVVDDAGIVGVMRGVSDGDSDFVNSQCPRESPKISSPSITLAAAVEESAAAVTPNRCSLIFSMLRRWTNSRSSPIIMNPWSLKVRGLSSLSIEVRRESDHDDFAK